MTSAYPLTWPSDFPRTKMPKTSRFKTSIAGALNNVQVELRRFGNDSGKPVSSLVISSNVSIGVQHPGDGAVAVYFRWENMDCCIAVDIYKFPEENLQAIALIVEAERTKLRHGGLNIVRASFRGFTALPPPAGGKPIAIANWWATLGFKEAPETLEAAEAAYRKLVKHYHPDSNPDVDPAKFNQVVDAMRQARDLLK